MGADGVAVADVVRARIPVVGARNQRRRGALVGAVVTGRDAIRVSGAGIPDVCRALPRLAAVGTVTEEAVVAHGSVRYESTGVQYERRYANLLA